MFKNLIHPAGFKQYADFRVDETILVNNISILDYPSTTISGTVNVNSSIYITGINTKFIAAQSLGLISVGTKVSVNNEIRYINNILNDTSIIVGSSFSQTANLQEMIILSEVEPLLVFTESNSPIITENNEIITL